MEIIKSYVKYDFIACVIVIYSISQYNSVVIDIFKGVIADRRIQKLLGQGSYNIYIYIFLGMQILRGALKNGHIQTNMLKTIEVP